MKTILISLSVIATLYMLVGCGAGWMLSSSNDEKPTLKELLKFALIWPKFFFR